MRRRQKNGTERRTFARTQQKLGGGQEFCNVGKVNYPPPPKEQIAYNGLLVNLFVRFDVTTTYTVDIYHAFWVCKNWRRYSVSF